MMRRLFSVMLLTAAAPLFAADTPPADVRSAADVLPQSVVIYGELSDPVALLSTVLDHPLVDKVEQLPPYQAALASAPYQRFTLGRQMVENQLGMPWREALEAVAAGGVYFAVDSATEGVAVLIRSKDAATAQLFRDKLIPLVMMGKNGNQLQSVQYRGIHAYRLGDVRYAVVGQWSLLTNHSDLGKEILDRLIDPADPRDALADHEAFRSSRPSQPPTGWAFIDAAAIRDANVAEAFFSGKANHPVAELLVGGIMTSLQHTDRVTMQVDVTPQMVDVAITMPHQHAWVEPSRQYYFGEQGSGRGPRLPVVDGTLLTVSSYRDLSQMWLHAGDLYDENINDAMAQADANLTTLFAGKDFGEDILGSLEPQIGIVVVRQDFADVLPRPSIQLPAAALVMQLRDPDTMTRELRRTFQSVVGFFNIVGAMQGNPQLEMSIETPTTDTELITAHYVPEPDDEQSEQAPIVFNFSPSVGFAGSRFVLASSAGLARRLTAANDASPNQDQAAAVVNTHGQLQASVLRQILADNREQLIAQNMLSEGNGRQEAEAAIDLMLELIGFFQDATLQLQTTEDQLQIQFNVKVQS